MRIGYVQLVVMLLLAHGLIFGEKSVYPCLDVIFILLDLHPVVFIFTGQSFDKSGKLSIYTFVDISDQRIATGVKPAVIDYLFDCP